MRIDIAELLRPHGRDTGPEVILAPPPLAGSRGQRLQRLQVGVFGLVAMVLLVGLANIIKTNAERTDRQVVAESASEAQPATVAEPASDPLADAGVVPDMPTQNKPKGKEPVAAAVRPAPTVVPGNAVGSAPRP